MCESHCVSFIYESFSFVQDVCWCSPRQIFKCYSAQGKIYYQSLFAKREYLRCYAVYQILSEIFGVVGYVTKVEVVKQRMGRWNSHRCITLAKVSRMHPEKRILKQWYALEYFATSMRSNGRIFSWRAFQWNICIPRGCLFPKLFNLKNYSNRFGTEQRMDKIILNLVIILQHLKQNELILN